MREFYGVVMLKSWVQPVATHCKAVVRVVGLYPDFLPTRFVDVIKWVGFYLFHPQQSILLSPTHFWQFTSVKKSLSTLSTPPIKNSNYVNRMNNKGVSWV
jgi:hypothetical protein